MPVGIILMKLDPILNIKTIAGDDCLIRVVWALTDDQDNDKIQNDLDLVTRQATSGLLQFACHTCDPPDMCACAHTRACMCMCVRELKKQLFLR